MTGSFSRRLKFRDNFPHSCTAAGLHGLMRSGRLLIDKIFVTAQVFRSGSSQSEGLDQGVRVLSKGLQDIPALLFGGRDRGTVDGESIGPVCRPKAARDLLLDLHHASVLLRLVVGKGNVWIGQEA